jgi:hypothetical protein
MSPAGAQGEGRNALHKAGYACISTLEEALKVLRSQELERCKASEALLTDRNRLGRVLADRMARLKQDHQRVAGKAMIIKVGSLYLFDDHQGWLTISFAHP